MRFDAASPPAGAPLVSHPRLILKRVPCTWIVRSPTGIPHEGWTSREEELRAGGRVSISADRRKDQRTGRLAGQDPLQASRPDQTGRSRGGRGVEVEKAFSSRGSGVVSPRSDLHRRDVQERCETHVLQRGLAEGPFGTVQLKPRR